eukprot:gene11063-17713_t
MPGRRRSEQNVYEVRTKRSAMNRKKKRKPRGKNKEAEGDVADSIAEEGGGTDAAGGEEGEDTAAATAADSGGALPASGSADGAANKDGAANGDVDGEGEDLDEEAAMLAAEAAEDAKEAAASQRKADLKAAKRAAKKAAKKGANKNKSLLASFHNTKTARKIARMEAASTISPIGTFLESVDAQEKKKAGEDDGCSDDEDEGDRGCDNNDGDAGAGAKERGGAEDGGDGDELNDGVSATQRRKERRAQKLEAKRLAGFVGDGKGVVVDHTLPSVGADGVLLDAAGDDDVSAADADAAAAAAAEAAKAAEQRQEQERVLLETKQANEKRKRKAQKKAKAWTRVGGTSTTTDDMEMLKSVEAAAAAEVAAQQCRDAAKKGMKKKSKGGEGEGEGEGDEEELERLLSESEEEFEPWIPNYRESLFDNPTGLFAYLQEKVKRHNTCLSCNKKLYSLEAVRGHMKDTSHCKVNFRGDDGAQELAAFYNISATTSSDGTGTTLALGKEGAKLRISNTGELVLRDGTKIGHRSMRKYYKQNFS